MYIAPLQLERSHVRLCRSVHGGRPRLPCHYCVVSNAIRHIRSVVESSADRSMATDAQTPIERIKQKLDIVDEIGAVVSLKKSGKAYKGLCPFHGERTPSFYVFPDNGTYHCFGCHEYGDIFTFVEKQQNLDFRDALALLAERAGIPLESSGFDGDAAPSPEQSARKRLRALNDTAAIWFHHQLLQANDA